MYLKGPILYDAASSGDLTEVKQALDAGAHHVNWKNDDQVVFWHYIWTIGLSGGIFIKSFKAIYYLAIYVSCRAAEHLFLLQPLKVTWKSWLFFLSGGQILALAMR